MPASTIIIKASDYRYPSRAELKAVYKVTPELGSFGFTSDHPIISLVSKQRTKFTEMTIFSIEMAYCLTDKIKGDQECRPH